MRVARILAIISLCTVLNGCSHSKGGTITSPTSPSPSNPSTPSTPVNPAPVPAPAPPSAPSIPGAFGEGMVSINFDDGRTSAYNDAIPALDAAGFKSTNYIITGRFSAPTYIGIAEVLSLQSRGHEIGAHTRSHLDTMASMTSAQLQDEIAGSRGDLLRIGVREVPTFAYPFGIYSPTITQVVKNAGFTAARSTNGGFNLRTTDKYVLMRLNLGSSTTIAQVRSSIDSAASDKTWLILLAHSVDSSVSDFSITPASFREIVKYLVDKKIRVVTMSEGIRLMNP